MGQIVFQWNNLDMEQKVSTQQGWFYIQIEFYKELDSCCKIWCHNTLYLHWLKRTCSRIFKELKHQWTSPSFYLSPYQRTCNSESCKKGKTQQTENLRYTKYASLQNNIHIWFWFWQMVLIHDFGKLHCFLVALSCLILNKLQSTTFVPCLNTEYVRLSFKLTDRDHAGLVQDCTSADKIRSELIHSFLPFREQSLFWMFRVFLTQ